MDRRLRFALLTAGACLLAALAGTWAAALDTQGDGASPSGSTWAGAIRPPDAGVPGFSLRDQDGERVTSASLRSDGPVVFTFVYSTCEDTCPLMVQQIRGALDEIGRDVPVVGVSVDPARDTPARARRFLLEQRMTGRMRFLLGTRDELRRVWEAFGIAPQTEGAEHSAHVVLADGEGRQRIGFPAARLTSDGLAADLLRLGA